MLRLLGIVLAVLAALAAAVLTWPSFFRVEQLFPVAQMIAFRSILLAVMAAVFSGRESVPRRSAS